MKFIITLFSVILFSSFSFAGWQEDFEVIKDIPRNYEDSGSICEEFARAEMQREFPAPQYEVIVGIAYGDENRIFGELDLVILDNNLQKIIKIGEVKCWKDLPTSLTKAQEQRARFLKAKGSPKTNRFVSTSTNQNFSPELFRQVKEFFSMGPKGSTDFGFDRELEYTLKEMHTFRIEMIKCQRQGQCAKP